MLEYLSYSKQYEYNKIGIIHSGKYQDDHCCFVMSTVVLSDVIDKTTRQIGLQHLSNNRFHNNRKFQQIGYDYIAVSDLYVI